MYEAFELLFLAVRRPIFTFFCVIGAGVGLYLGVVWIAEWTNLTVGLFAMFVVGIPFGLCGHYLEGRLRRWFGCTEGAGGELTNGRDNHPRRAAGRSGDRVP